jgi:hypothetical protein
VQQSLRAALRRDPASRQPLPDGVERGPREVGAERPQLAVEQVEEGRAALGRVEPHDRCQLGRKLRVRLFEAAQRVERVEDRCIRGRERPDQQPVQPPRSSSTR